MSARRSTTHFDAIVIGVGSMGSAACWFLARRGLNVLGLEQFGIVHERGSHFGQSRIIRKAYFEHPDYVPLLQRSYENWSLLERDSKSKVFHRTGILYLGARDSPILSGVLKSSALYNVGISEVTPSEIRDAYPQFDIPDNFIGIVEPDAGFITPESAIKACVEQAAIHGADIRANERVVRWEASEKISVTTISDAYTCDKLVITAGSWTSGLISLPRELLTVTKQMLAWVSPRKPDRFALGTLPCWFVDDPERGAYYGFPLLKPEAFGEPGGLKLAHHVHGEKVDPDAVERSVSPGTEADLSYFLNRYLKSAEGEFTTFKSCLYTNTPDENFIIDHLPGTSKRVTIACGFSGHGFKFVSAVGEILADLAIEGRTQLPIDFLRLSRFDTKKSSPLDGAA